MPSEPLGVPSSARLNILGLGGCYVAAILVVYPILISPSYTYMGFTRGQDDLLSSVLAITFALLPLTFSPVSFSRPSNLIYILLYLFTYVPACLVPYLTNLALFWSALPLMLVMLCSMAVLVVFSRHPLVVTYRIPLPFSAYVSLLIGLTALTLGFNILVFGSAALKMPSWGLAIYDQRSDYKDIVSRLGGFAAYVALWQTKVVSPLLLVLSLSSRTYALIGLVCVVQAVLFSVTGVKSMLFMPVLVVAVYQAICYTKKQAFAFLLLLAVIMICVTAALDVIAFDGYPAFTGLTVRRLILIPGLLSGYYFEFFSRNPVACYADSRWLSFNGTSPYSGTVAQTIGSLYFGSSAASANANLFADAFANLSYLGPLLVASLLGYLLVLFDSIARNVPLKYSAAAIAISGLSLTNTSLQTVVTSHGLAAIIIAFYFFPDLAIKNQPMRSSA